MSDVVLHWSRERGKFVDKRTGQTMVPSSLAVGPLFTGTAREWYETFVETIIDASNHMHRKHMSAPTLLIVPPDLHVMLMASVLYWTNDDITSHVGTLASRYKVYEDKDMPRDEVHLKYDFHDERLGVVKVLDMNML